MYNSILWYFEELLLAGLYERFNSHTKHSFLVRTTFNGWQSPTPNYKVILLQSRRLTEAF